MKLIFTILWLPLALIACVSANDGQTLGHKQGIQGRVVELTGNQMPGPGRKPDPGQPRPNTRVYVFEKAAMNQVKGSAPFYDSIYTKQVASGLTDDSGFYKIGLPEGSYSVFVKAEGKYYSGIMDNDAINPVEVSLKNWSDLNITLSYKAAF